MSWNYGIALCEGDEGTGGTLDDIREAVTILEETAPIARRVLGGAHPLTVGIDASLRAARPALRARETQSDELDEVENA